jgi:hypothetical protein
VTKRLVAQPPNGGQTRLLPPSIGGNVKGILFSSNREVNGITKRKSVTELDYSSVTTVAQTIRDFKRNGGFHGRSRPSRFHRIPGLRSEQTGQEEKQKASKYVAIIRRASDQPFTGTIGDGHLTDIITLTDTAFRQQRLKAWQ